MNLVQSQILDRISDKVFYMLFDMDRVYIISQNSTYNHVPKLTSNRAFAI